MVQKAKNRSAKKCIKEYICKFAYRDNYYVIQIIDGKIKSDSIVPYYELTGFLNALKSMGFKECYFVPEYKSRLDIAKKELEYAQAVYDEALRSPAIFDDYERERYMKITNSSMINEDF